MLLPKGGLMILVLWNISNTAKGQYGDGGGSTERPYESENLSVTHMESVIGVDAYPNKLTRLSDNRKNLTTVGIRE